MRALPALLLLAATQATAVPMYKCVDARGVTHYTETPHSGCVGRAVDIKPLPPPSGAQQAPARDLGEQERDFRRRQLERGRDEEKEAKAAKAREQRCRALRAEHSRMTSGRRVVQYDAKGERAYLEDAERARRAAQYQDEISRLCR